jgi:hypothetical protein
MQSIERGRKNMNGLQTKFSLMSRDIIKVRSHFYWPSQAFALPQGWQIAT